MEKAEITVPVGAGLMGKAEVRKFGSIVEVYVKALDPELSLAKGAIVRIVESTEEFCIVEPFEEFYIVEPR